MIPQDRITNARKELLAAQDELIKVLKSNKSRARAPVVRMLHEVRGMLHPAYPYASQAGQDQIVDRIMKGKTGGTFVDVGGYDGLLGPTPFSLKGSVVGRDSWLNPLRPFESRQKSNAIAHVFPLRFQKMTERLLSWQ